MKLNQKNLFFLILSITLLKSISGTNSESIELDPNNNNNNANDDSISLSRKLIDNDEDQDIHQQMYRINNLQSKKPLKNIFMGIYKNYRSTYLGNRTANEYKKSLQDYHQPALYTDVILNKNNMKETVTSEIPEKETEIVSDEVAATSIKTKKKKKKKKKNSTNKKDFKGYISKKNDDTLLYDYNGEYRYNLGPAVNLTLDMNRDIVNVNLDEDCLKDIFLQNWDSDNISGRGRGKKQEMLSKILPLFILPFLIQSAIIPFLVTKLKLLLVKSILVGKLAIFLLIISAIRNNQKTPTYEAAPAYWASEPSRRSEIFSGYRVEGRPTTWVN